MELSKLIENEDGVEAAVSAFHQHLPPEVPFPTSSSEDGDHPNPLQWFFTQIGKLCCLPCCSQTFLQQLIQHCCIDLCCFIHIYFVFISQFFFICICLGSHSFYSWVSCIVSNKEKKVKPYQSRFIFTSCIRKLRVLYVFLYMYDLTTI